MDAELRMQLQHWRKRVRLVDRALWAFLGKVSDELEAGRELSLPVAAAYLEEQGIKLLPWQRQKAGLE